ncbi:MAG: hypothetical protein M3Z08_12280 [Chloroflexota bacterium]|nr:hypothetical protein [Chloroflexota bacterium]
MKKKLRRIMVDRQIYLWKFVPGYVATHDPANPWQCHDHFTAYRLQMKASPLQVSFRSWEDPVSGGPLRTGISPDRDEIPSPSGRVNLHTPKYAAWIIQRALKAGWQPEQSRVPFVMEQGLQWLIQGREGVG